MTSAIVLCDTFNTSMSVMSISVSAAKSIEEVSIYEGCSKSLASPYVGLKNFSRSIHQ